MSAAIELEAATRAWMIVGTVAAVEPVIQIWTARGREAAAVAPSCLIALEAGDDVLVATRAGRAPTVVAVLERARPTDDVTVASVGRLRLAAGTELALDAGRAVAASAPEITLRARKGEAIFAELDVIADRVAGTFKTARAAAARVESLVGVLTQRLGRSFREVEHEDVTRAGDVDVRARGLASVKGRNATMVADELVRLDGSQIHVG